MKIETMNHGTNNMTPFSTGKSGGGGGGARTAAYLSSETIYFYGKFTIMTQINCVIIRTRMKTPAIRGGNDAI